MIIGIFFKNSIFKKFNDRLSWYVCKSWYFIIDLCVWSFWKQFSKFFLIRFALSAPGYSWDAMLRFTLIWCDVNLKLISDIERYQFFEIMIRGGISMICIWYVEANKYLKQIYFMQIIKIQIIYIDILPKSILDWVNPKDFSP